MKWVNRLYIIFLGIILTITTGYGIAAFYPEQRAPIYPSSKPYITSPSSCYSTPQEQQSEECKKYLEEEKVRQAQDSKRQEEYQKKVEEYQNTNSAYTRTAVFLGISVGTLFVVLGLAMLKSSHLVSNGLLFAGVLTAVLTRVLVGIASLGSRVTGTDAADQMSYIQFAVLVILSVAVTFVGFSTLKEEKK